MLLSGETFNRLIEKFGVTVIWEKAMECPCRIRGTGDAETHCPICEGIKYFWEDPQETCIAVQALQTTQQWSQFGEWDKGDVMATIGSDSCAYEAGEFDRFTVKDSKYRFNTVLCKGARDQVKHKAITTVDRVIAIVNNQLEEFREHDHFAVEGNKLVWHLQTNLSDGTQYSLRYIAGLEYYVFGPLIQDRPQFCRDLPKKGMLRLMDLFGQGVNG